MTDTTAPEDTEGSKPLQDTDPQADSSRNHRLALAFAALGVVFGDIGTSPLYAVKECFRGKHAMVLNADNILGVASLIFWSLTIVVSIKYVGFILRMDNRGEGGIFALLGLTSSKTDQLKPRLNALVILAALCGASLLYGDGIITPAITVLSSIEGLNVATTAAQRFVVPLTCVILFGLFLVQKHGTGTIGKIFGPVMLVWFVVIAVLGLREIFSAPHILRAINPLYAVRFFAINHLHGFIVLGSVVLCITGGEALYADLGHFGRRAIRVAWFGLACPALLCNYLGQAALLLDHPALADNPFYGLAPRPLLYPMVALATVAAIIASQALISGVFSLTNQAVQLGYCPRLRILHTARETEGQIYIAGVNTALGLACIGVVLIFKQSSGLAGAYGLAVTASMSITSLLYFVVVTKTFRWPLRRAIPLVGIFLLFDLSFVGANLFKIREGGWFTLLMAACVLTLMQTWKDGRKELSRKMLEKRFPLELFLEDLSTHNLPRIPGTSVFMTVSPIGTPAALLHAVKHIPVLHEHVVLLSIRTVDIPSVPAGERLKIEDLGHGFYRLIALYGFMESPNIPDIMRLAAEQGLATNPATTSYFLGRESLLTTGDAPMQSWRKSLFAFMSRNASNPTSFFGIPPNRVVELGAQIQL